MRAIAPARPVTCARLRARARMRADARALCAGAKREGGGNEAPLRPSRLGTAMWLAGAGSWDRAGGRAWMAESMTLEPIAGRLSGPCGRGKWGQSVRSGAGSGREAREVPSCAQPTELTHRGKRIAAEISAIFVKKGELVEDVAETCSSSIGWIVPYVY